MFLKLCYYYTTTCENNAGRMTAYVPKRQEQMQMKKATAWLLALVLVVLSVPMCFADVTTDSQTMELKDLNITVDVPAGMYVFTEDTDPVNGDWLLAGYESGFEKLEEFKVDDESGNLKALELVPEDKSYTITVSRKYSDQTREYYSMKDASQEQLDELVSSNTFTDEENGITAKSTLYQQKEIPFLAVELTGQADGKDVWEYCFVTIVNGYSITLDMYSYDEITEEQKAVLQSMTDSVHITEYFEKPTQAEVNFQTFLAMLPVIAVVVLLLLFILITRITAKKKEQQRKEVADRLSEYRKEQAKRIGEEESGESIRVLVENVTDCNDEAVKKMVLFHLFRKNLLRSAMFVLLGVISIIMGIVYDDSWFMRLVLVGLGAYVGAQPFLMIDKMNKSEIGVYKKARTREARYYFRADDFRITGIQSAALYPYFQILDAYESGGYFYLYYADERAYILKADCFTQGSAEEFRNLLRKQLGKHCHF